MPTLYKTVRINGSGDYTDFVTGVSGILASGLASTGYYDRYVLSVDSGVYSGYFTAEVPYTGVLSIIGSGTWWCPQGTSLISGVSPLGGFNVELSNFTIDAPWWSQKIFTVYSGSSLNLIDTEFLRTSYGILNSGALYLQNVSAQGVGPVSGGCFIEDRGYTSISNSRIAYFVSGIYTSDTSIVDSSFTDNLKHIVGIDTGIISVNNITINGGGSGIVFECTPTGEVFITNASIKTWAPIVVSGVNLWIDRSIIWGNTYCIYGVVETGLISETNLYPSGTLVSIPQTHVHIHNPQWVDVSNGDFRLKFKQTTGSPCVEVVDQGILSSGVDLYTEQAQFNITDSRGTPQPNTFTNFIYRQGNTLLLSDYLKEIEFAKTTQNFSSLSYNVEMIANFDASGITVNSAFNKLDASFPFDWDYRTFNTTEITNRHKYIVPRSVLSIEDTISPHIGSFLPSVVFNKIDKRNITPYLFADYRGVAYDYDLSVPGQAIVWMIEGNNQMLIQLNAFTGERLAEYPMFVPELSGSLTIKPSGVVGVGVYKDQYKFVLETDPNFEMLCDNQDGFFPWIYTALDTHKDARGLLAYKGNLFATITEYNPQSIFDRTTIPIYSGAIGKLVMYNNNDTFEHYIANYTTQVGPSAMVLATGNCYPTDITVYEDGSLLVADWTESHSLFRYKLAYDYALVQSTYDTETRILLREYYDNVEL